jgi:serine/threonine protein phosphatase PrpC
MPGTILGSDSNSGGRRYNEDRVGTLAVPMADGAELAIAIVCDGVGGEARGERAAQLGVDTFLEYFRTNAPRAGRADVLNLMVAAVKQANAVAYAEACRLEQEGRMAATLVCAIVVDGETLFIGNAGDSRAYLVSDGSWVQLTRDHAFSNVMVWLGRMTPEEAAAHPDANKVMRVLGIKEDIQVDVGFYHNTTDYGEANRAGRQGMALKPGDVVLLCSDGLIKLTPRQRVSLASEQDIVRAVTTQEGEAAARAIMGQVLGRIPVGDPVDNITVAVLQTPDPNRKNAAAPGAAGGRWGRVALLVGAVAVALALLLVATVALGAWAWIGRQSAQENLAGTATRLAQATQVAAAQSATVAAYTATPSATPTTPPTATPVPTDVPAAVPGEIARLFNADTFISAITDSGRELVTVPAGETRYVAMTYLRYHSPDPSAAQDGNVYLQENTRLQFGLVTEKLFQLTLLSGGELFLQTGPYASGAEVQLANSSVVFYSKGCLALSYPAPDKVQAVCYKGECSFVTEIGGTAMDLAVGATEAPASAAIGADNQERQWQLLAHTSAGLSDAGLCGVPNVQATQAAQAAARRLTATAAATRLTPPATATVAHSATPEGGSPPATHAPSGDTPAPPPADTPVSTPADTPQPPPSTVEPTAPPPPPP